MRGGVELLRKMHSAWVMRRRTGMNRRSNGEHSGRGAATAGHRAMPGRAAGAGGGAHRTLLPQIITIGTALFGTTAGAGGVKGFVGPPPGPFLIPICFFFAISFFIVALCMWFICGLFADPRFRDADPRTQVDLARRALAPILAVLGLLQKAPGKVRALS